MQDARLALRNLARRPMFSAVAILTLALGIGANTAVFTVSNAVLLAPLPYDRPDDVVILNEQTPQFASLSVTRYNYHDWRTRAKSFSRMAAFRPTSMTVTGSGDPERVPAKMITATLPRAPHRNAGDDRDWTLEPFEPWNPALGVACPLGLLTVEKFRNFRSRFCEYCSAHG